MKMHMKRIFMIFLSITILMTNFTFLSVKADEKVTITSSNPTGYSHSGTARNGAYSITFFNSNIAILKISNGNIGFCVEPWMPLADSSVYTPTQKDRLDFSKIIYHGYWNTKQTAYDYAVTQLMIWEVLGYYPDTHSVSNYENRKKSIQKLINTHDTLPSIHKNTYEVMLGNTLTLTDKNDVISQFGNWKADGCTIAVKGNQLMITPTKDVKDTVQVYADKYTNASGMGASYLYNSSGYQQIYAGKLKDPIKFRMIVNVKKYGALKITKLDEDGTLVADTKFKISYHADMSNPIGSFTTGKDGTVKVEQLLPQPVYIQEVSVPSHLVLDPTIHQAEIQVDKLISYTAHNRWKKGKVRLMKLDADTEDQVGNAVYAIFDAKGKELQRLKTKQDTWVESEYLRYGDYTLKEVEAPEGYVVNEEAQSFTISEEEQRLVLHGIDRSIKGQIKVVKKDQESGKDIIAATTTFQIYQADGTLIGELITDASGCATSELLRYGDYYLIEKKAPFNYVQNEKKLIYKIREDGKTYAAEYTNLRTKGSIEIKKKDMVTGDQAQGEGNLNHAVYGLYAEANIVDPADHQIIYKKDEKITELITDKQGFASVEDLYLGSYYVKEITPSFGYTLDHKKYVVNLDYQNQNEKVVLKKQIVQEKVISQAFSIIKVSDNGNGEADLLKGVEFTIKSQKDIEKAGSFEKAPIAKNAMGKTAAILVSDEKGFAQSDELPYGTYIVRETKSLPNHHKVDDFKVVIEEDSRTPQVWRVMDDTKFKAVVSIVKKDRETKQRVALAGAKFKIKDMQKNTYVGFWVWNPFPHYVDEWTSDEHGQVMSDAVLSPGKYQIEESKAPQGYVLNKEPVPFTISDTGAFELLPDGKTPYFTVEMEDTPVKGRISISKEGELLDDIQKNTNGDIQFLYKQKKLKNVVFDIYAAENIYTADHHQTLLYAQNTLVERITTDAQGNAISKKLPLGRYIVKEHKALDGFLLSNDAITIALTYQDQFTEVVMQETGTILNQRQKAEVAIKKADIQDHQPLAGAVFSLYANQNIKNADGKVLLKANEKIETITTGKDGIAQFCSDLPVHPKSMTGDDAATSLFYVLEDKAPNGYVSSHEKVYIDTDITQPLVEVQHKDHQLYNQKTKLQISKLDITNHQELAGNHMQIKNKEGAIVAEWISTNQPHVIEGLPVGEYTLCETIPAPGYTTAHERSFMITDTLDIQKVDMENIPTTIDFLKIDEQGKPLAGSHLAVKDQAGNVIDEWVSDGKVHHLQHLIIRQEYSLCEIQPTDGYATAKDITFQVQDDQNRQQVIMKNQPTDISVMKVDVDTKKQLSGAVLAMVDPSGKELVRWTSDGKPHHLQHLIEGKTYTIKEVQAPYGYELAKPQKVIVKQDEQISFENKQIKKMITIMKIDQDHPEKGLPNAKFALYADQACTKLLQADVTDAQGRIHFNPVPYGTYYVKEQRAPDGYQLQTKPLKIIIDEHYQEATIAVPNQKKAKVASGDQSASSQLFVFLIVSFGGLLLCLKRKKDIGKRF